MNEYPKLSYFLSQKKEVLIVSFVGPLVRSNAHIFEECIKEIANSGGKWVILNFRDVPATEDRSMFPTLARLQKTIRAMPAELRLSSIHPDLKRALESQGILRGGEVVNNLADALQSFAAKRAA